MLSNGNLTCSQVYDNGTNVGIGTTSPVYKLSVNGPIHSMANIFISDKKFKKNITDIRKPLETVLKLNGKKYNWKVKEFEQYDFSDRKQIGFIAQEVKKIIPEIVYIDKKSGEYSMNYSAIIPLLVEAIKEQQNQITLLENKISDIKKVSNTDEGLTLGDRTSFSTNYPNPFSSSTTVDYFIMKNVKNAKFIIWMHTYPTRYHLTALRYIIGDKLARKGLNKNLTFSEKNLHKISKFVFLTKNKKILHTNAWGYDKKTKLAIEKTICRKNKKYFLNNDEYLDRATDGQHAGPKSHKSIANKIYQHIQNNFSNW